jgi:hypothetical protein
MQVVAILPTAFLVFRVNLFRGRNILDPMNEPLTDKAYIISLSELILSNLMHRKEFLHKSIPKPLRTDNLVMYFRKNFYLSKSINQKLSRLTSSGIVDYVMKKYLDFHQADTPRGPRQLQMKHLLGIFHVLFIGLTIGFGLFLYEQIDSCMRRMLRAKQLSKSNHKLISVNDASTPSVTTKRR